MEYRSLTLDDFLSRFQLLRPQINRETLNHRQAAVLIPIVRRPQPGLLLTQRSIHLRKHAGQVAFPGGAVDDTDASAMTWLGLPDHPAVRRIPRWHYKSPYNAWSAPP